MDNMIVSSLNVNIPNKDAFIKKLDYIQVAYEHLRKELYDGHHDMRLLFTNYFDEVRGYSEVDSATVYVDNISAQSLISAMEDVLADTHDYLLMEVQNNKTRDYTMTVLIGMAKTLPAFINYISERIQTRNGYMAMLMKLKKCGRSLIRKAKSDDAVKAYQVRLDIEKIDRILKKMKKLGYTPVYEEIGRDVDIKTFDSFNAMVVRAVATEPFIDLWGPAPKKGVDAV